MRALNLWDGGCYEDRSSFPSLFTIGRVALSGVDRERQNQDHPHVGPAKRVYTVWHRTKASAERPNMLPVRRRRLDKRSLRLRSLKGAFDKRHATATPGPVEPLCAKSKGG